MADLDLKKTLKQFYNPPAQTVSLVDVPPFSYLMIDGQGNPNTSQAYVQAVEALYALAYSLRFMRKAEGDVFTVMPLEGLWTIKGAPNETFTLTEADKDDFVWTMMIMQPEQITAEMVERAREIARKKKAPARLDALRFERYHEGECVQIMHIGPYAAEGPNIAKLHHHIEANGWHLGLRHHEIYLSDPRKTAPEKMKTIIRQPYTR